MSPVEVSDGFAKKAGAIQNEPALQGKSPLLVVTAALALGALTVRLIK
jgi:hypothetical protein